MDAVGIIAILTFIGGILVGTHTAFWIQLIIFIGLMLYLNSEHVRLMELGAIIPYIWSIALIIGMLVGDLSWAFQVDAFKDMTFSNPFAVGE